MSGAAGSSGDAYDAIVIGAGLGGLSAAAYLAKFGRRVLVVDRQDGPGGYAHAFQRGPYLFDPAIHGIAQALDGQTIDQLLRYLDVRERCTLVPFETLYGVAMPGLTLDLPNGLEAFVEAHSRHFPHEAEAIRRFFALCAQIFREARQLPPQFALRDLDQEAERFPAFFKYRTASLGDLLDEHFDDPRLKAVCAASWPYMGVPPHRLSFDMFARMLLLEIDGLCHCVGSFQRLADAFVFALERHGGELLLDNRVNRILIEGGRVTGITLEDGRRFTSPVVVSNADARQTFERMVGVEQLPSSFLRRLQRLEPSLSAFVLFAATTLPLHEAGVAHETFVHTTWDHAEAYREIHNGQPGGMWLTVPTLVDRTLAPAGEHLAIFSSLAAYDIGIPWVEAKDRYTELMLDRLEGLLPGIRDQLTFVEAATPWTLERYTLNGGGSIYGWANTPTQVGSKRLGYLTPVEGLYLSGHWSQAGSSLRVIVSGTHVAQIVLERSGVRDVGPAF